MLLGEDVSGKFLYCKGREIEEYRFIVKMNDKCRWERLGHKARARPSGCTSSACWPTQGVRSQRSRIAEKLHGLMEHRNVANLLPVMAKEREIHQRGRGVYSLQSHMTDLDPAPAGQGTVPSTGPAGQRVPRLALRRRRLAKIGLVRPFCPARRPERSRSRPAGRRQQGAAQRGAVCGGAHWLTNPG